MDITRNRYRIIQATLMLTLAATLALAVPQSVTAQGTSDAASTQEAKLIAVLKSEAPKAEKAITCKLLAIHGSGDAIPELAKLLSDPQLASWARIALEAIPVPAADEVLRTAAKSLTGKLQIGVINSIGVRQDEQAAKWLAETLTDSDEQVAAAAAAALGRIGNEAATASLRKALATAPPQVRSAVAEGCILCAERLQSEGKTAEAIALYDQVRQADVPQQRVIEATRGVILARGQDGIPLLLELLKSSDKKLMRLALGMVREFPGDQLDHALATALESAPADRAALIIYAMADRPQTVELAVIRQAASQGPKPVRIAALESLGRIGNADCLSTLLDVSRNSDTDLADAAKQALATLPASDIDARIVALLDKADTSNLPLLLEVVGLRRISASPTIRKALQHTDGRVRRAALGALGETIEPGELSLLIAQVVSPRHTEDTKAATEALRAAGVRMPDREACAAELAKAMGDASSISTKISLLEIIASVGGTNALAAMDKAAKSSDSRLQDASTRLLGKWMTDDAAPVLLDLAKTMPNKKYRVRALRGYIRIARQFVLPAPKRAEMCRQALAASQQLAEKQLVLQVLERYPSGRTLRVAIEARRDPELKKQATQTTRTIARHLKNRGVDVNRLLKNTDIRL